MTLFSTLFLAGALALGFFFIVDGILYYVSNTGDRGESRKLRRLAIRETIVERTARIQAVTADQADPTQSITGYLDDLIQRADMTIPRERLLIVMALIAATTLVLLMFLASWLPLVVQIIMAISAGVFLPIQYLKGKSKKRADLFSEQFPEALDLIVRSLRIGHPLATAIQTIAHEAQAPTGPEFEIVSRQVTYGKTPAEAIAGLARRIDSPDVRFFSVAVQIHHEAGGNLGDILSGLSKIIRARFQLFRKVKALTAEGNFSAYFLSAFPVVMIFAMNAMQPGYYEKVSDIPIFGFLVGLTAVLLVVNVFAMRMITKLEV